MRVRLSYVGGLMGSTRALRTEHVEGEADALPVVGQPFTMIGKGLDFGSRLVTTSPVAVVLGFDFLTESGSHYRLVLLGPEA